MLFHEYQDNSYIKRNEKTMKFKIRSTKYKTKDTRR